ncbi:carbohydrate kinase family protein [Phnomibacter sp. MR]|uniref:carbohydrate kinase family protein n=1 Tax=Phnomibacter sp. MR TaxID=3042318 RepID=UPI003A7FE32D
MAKVLCIGEALIDMICTDKGKPLSDGENFLKKAGGAPANVAAAIAALGGSVDMTAKVGVDPFGQHLVEMLNHMGVNTQYVFRDAKHFTTFAFVSLMENGERDFYFNRGADGELSIDDLAQINLDEFSIIHFGSATGFLPGPLQAAYVHLLQQALQRNLLVSFDPNYRELLFGQNKPSFVEQSWPFLKAANFFKLSDEEAMLLTNTDTVADAAAQLLQATSGVFAITLGAAGTLLGINGQTQLIGSIPVKPVDTTGAGDAFVGAVLYQLSQLTPQEQQSLDATAWQQIVLNGNKAGARTCEYMGAMEAFKHLNKNIFG